MDFEKQLARLEFEHPIMNGPGWACKTIEEVEVLAASASSGIMVGAITKEARLGNPGDTACFDIPYLSSNSLGMPNGGRDYYENEGALVRMVEIAHAVSKPIIVNVAGFSLEEFVGLAFFVQESGADIIQLNLSCPNIHDEGKKKGRIFAFDLDMTRDIVTAVRNALIIPIDVKLSPMSDPIQREEMAYLMKELGVDVVTLCNTFPNVLIYGEDLKPAIYSKLPQSTITMGGMGGPAMKPISLAHVALFRSILSPDQCIVGIGGAENGRDVIEYEEAGADIVQVTTAHAVRGTKVFDQMLSEYVRLKQGE